MEFYKINKELKLLATVRMKESSSFGIKEEPLEFKIRGLQLAVQSIIVRAILTPSSAKIRS